MLDVIEIREKLMDTQAAIERTKRAIADHPDRRTLLLQMRSLEARLRTLEGQFLLYAESVGEDVCAYRMFADDPARPSQHDPSIAGLAAVLAAFQGLFTIVFDAVTRGRKATATVPPDVQELTSFQFGYAFPGSTGIVLTVARKRKGALLENAAITTTGDAILTMMSAHTSNDVHEAAAKYGVAAVRSLRKLSDAHVKHKIGATVEWRVSERPVSSKLFSMADLRQLKTAIDETSEETTEEMTIIGDLVAVDLRSKRFGIELLDKTKIAGRFETEIDKQHTVELPRRYAARIKKITRVVFSTDEDQVDYILESLEGPIAVSVPRLLPGFDIEKD
jgi:hypothetical protein